MATGTMGFGNREPLRAATDRPIENASSLIPTHPKLGVFEGNELRLPPACIRVCSCFTEPDAGPGTECRSVGDDWM